VKLKFLFSLTKRQCICFGAAAAIGIPVYFLTKGIIGNSSAVIVMILVMLPAFFVAMYEKDGQPAEKILRNILRTKWFYPGKRPYKTENFYKIIDKEGRVSAGHGQKAERAGKTAANKQFTAKGK
jgi:hypothetical protein